MVALLWRNCKFCAPIWCVRTASGHTPIVPGQRARRCIAILAAVISTPAST
jgi:hypothetical protein